MKIPQEVTLEKLRVQLGDAVDRVRADDREVRHTNARLGPLFDDGEAPRLVVILRESVHDLAQEAPVDLVDDLEVTGQEPREDGDRPALECFGQEGVVRVPERGDRLLPRRRPGHPFVVDEHAHQLRDPDGRVGIVQLDRDLVSEVVERLVSALVAPDDVVDGAGDEEVLLPEPQLLAGLEVVVRVKDLRDHLGRVLCLDGAHVVAGVEEREVEVLPRARGPQAKRVHRVGVEACDGGVVGDTVHLVGG